MVIIPSPAGAAADLCCDSAPDEVKATVPLLHKSLFGSETNKSYADAALVYINGGPSNGGSAIAMAVWHTTFSTWTGKGGMYLEDLYVDVEYRSKGVGKKLFNMLGKLCIENDWPRMDWVVLDVNHSAKKVYAAMGARQKTEWEGLRLEGEGIVKLARD